MFHKLFPPTAGSPIPKVWIIRVMVVLLVVIALAAGYFQTLLEQEHKRYLRLEDMYVRVRGELGVEETQRLIDQSRQAEP